MNKWNEEGIRLREVERSNRAYRDSQIGQEYIRCPKCWHEAVRNQYGTDYECRECGEPIDWTKGGVYRLWM